MGVGGRRRAVLRGVYFRVRPDFREYAPPVFGDFFVSTANWASDALLRRGAAARVVRGGLRPDRAGMAGVVRGRIGDLVFQDFGNLGGLVVENFFRMAAFSAPAGGSEKGFFARPLK